MDFTALPLSPALQDVLAELGFRTTTPVQAQSIPPLLAGRDLLGRSPTGSGKTAAFALPILQQLSLSPRQVQGLVVCPTRELATQVAAEIRRLGRRLPGLQVLVASGGQPARPQLQALEKGAHVVVGTPGRLLDLLDRGGLDTAALRTVVLDEADRMLDMGFRDDVERLLAALPDTRQTALFSATYPPDIAALSARFQRDPAQVDVTAHAPPPDVRQLAFACGAEEKGTVLLRVLRQFAPASAVVFCRLKAEVDAIAGQLRAERVNADSLQGDLEQDERVQVLARFRNRSIRVLVATDVAARGLDVEAIDLVVNLDLPGDADTYVHRIGRTARAGRSGLAVALVTPRDAERVREIERVIGKPLEHGTLEAPPPTPPELDAPMRTLVVFAGRKDKLRPGDLLGALTGEAQVAAEHIGKIEILDRLAYVAVAKDVAPLALERLRNGKIKGRKIRVERAR